ncbi:MAG: HAF repeat-containing protein, partial [Verrucomicrobia bacterium]|nr:HAF repeat-containing protein [Verrucomicrobiota bacterium]
MVALAHIQASPPQFSVTVLGSLGGTGSAAFSINASGQVTGGSHPAVGRDHAVRWTGTTPTDLGTLGGNTSFGYGINDFGQVVGVSRITGNSALHAFLYSGTAMTDLGTLGGPD